MNGDKFTFSQFEYMHTVWTMCGSMFTVGDAFYMYEQQNESQHNMIY